jgi:ubiquinone/menaquinone biosynthesis C-methylase UbiE
MQSTAYNIDEQQAAEAFNKQSSVFDAIYSPNVIIQYKRERVRSHVEIFLQRGSKILELNAGTGEDAIYFAMKGHCVHATDIAGEMQNVLKQKVAEKNLQSRVTTEICSFNYLESLHQKGPYDLIFSNFAGLNCTGELEKVLQSFSALLKQNGLITLVIMPRFCLWEFLLFARGNFKTAFRRFRSRNGVAAHIEGTYFTCWYYSPAFVERCLKNEFDVLSVEGLCTIVPPSYFENFPSKYSRLYAWLQKVENKFKSKWPWKNMGDYFIITFRKKSN